MRHRFRRHPQREAWVRSCNARLIMLSLSYRTAHTTPRPPHRALRYFSTMQMDLLAECFAVRMYILKKRKIVRDEHAGLAQQQADAADERFGCLTDAIYSDITSVRWRASHIKGLVNRFSIVGTTEWTREVHFCEAWVAYKRVHRAASA